MCWKCKKTLNFSPPIARTEICPQCGSDVHSCRNCRHYSVGSHYDCHETIDERITDKERSNFCGWFSLNPTVGQEHSKQGVAPPEDKAKDAKKAFDNLFGD